jgi:hypothetical protein
MQELPELGQPPDVFRDDDVAWQRVPSVFPGEPVSLYASGRPRVDPTQSRKGRVLARMRHKRLASTVLALGAGMMVAVPGTMATTAHSAVTTAPQTSAACAVTWGSLPKSRSATGLGTVHNIRAGRHACFDRLVFDIDGPMSTSAYVVRYVDHVRDDSGAVVRLRGGATLEVALAGHRFHPEDRAGVDVAGFRTFRQVASGSSDGRTTTFGLGVRARLPFRVYVLDRRPSNPPGFSRVVVDVAHRW